jgi:hypothetical protein
MRRNPYEHSQYFDSSDEEDAKRCLGIKRRETYEQRRRPS